MVTGQTYLLNRIDELGNFAEERLEEIPVDITNAELEEEPGFLYSLQLHEERMDWILAIRQELAWGIPLIPVKTLERLKEIESKEIPFRPGTDLNEPLY